MKPSPLVIIATSTGPPTVSKSDPIFRLSDVIFINDSAKLLNSSLGNAEIESNKWLACSSFSWLINSSNKSPKFLFADSIFEISFKNLVFSLESRWELLFIASLS